MRIGGPFEAMNVDFEVQFWTKLTQLGSQALEYLTRVLCYVQKRRHKQALLDMIKLDEWDVLLQNLRTTEDSVFKFTALININAMRKIWSQSERRMGSAATTEWSGRVNKLSIR